MKACPPPPARAGSRQVVAIDASLLRAEVRFDAAAQVATARATLELSVDGPDGYPAFDLRQDLGQVVFDGDVLGPDGVVYQDVGAGAEARTRVVDRVCPGGSVHRLEVEYELGTPQATGSLPVAWCGGDGVSWDLWMSDLEPGRYLEMWFPVGLCHDRLRIELDIEVVGTQRPHHLVANGDVAVTEPGRRWSVHFPATYTSLSAMLVLAPADELELHRARVALGAETVDITVAAEPRAGFDLASVASDTAAWLAQFHHRYGRWAHSGQFLAVMWTSPRGMEYDGATTASAMALEHEIFHSWFGRGVKPASAVDGWIDEAMATWATASARSSVGRYSAEPLELDQAPTLLCPLHPWSRHTPREAYAAGSRLLSGLAAMAGGPSVLRTALAAWHGAHRGGFGTTAELRRHLEPWCGQDLSPWWERYVYGGEPRPEG